MVAAGLSPHVYLASASPRRRELLAQIGVRFEVSAVVVDEAHRADEDIDAYVRRLALAKARILRELRDVAREVPVLAADTAVSASGELLGKPADEAQFVAMFTLLSGAIHEVHTAVSVISPAGESVTVSRSEVQFRDVTAAEMAAYWRSGEPADKAGGYAIQGIGAIFVQNLRGSYSGVMGLPLFETAALLREHGVPVLASGDLRS